jgi:hypothetical protein
MKLATHEEIAAWTAERRAVLTELLEHAQRDLADGERRAA